MPRRRDSTRIVRRLMAAALASGLTVASGPTFASSPEAATPETAPGLAARLEQLYASGEASFAAGDLDAAIESFSAGLDEVQTDGPARLRAYFSVSLAIALLDRHDATGDLADAERAHALLVRVVDEDASVLAPEPRLEALARRNLARARAVVPAEADPSPTSSEPRQPELPPDDPPAPIVEPAPPRAESPRAVRQRRIGIGLLVSGTAFVAGGVAVVIDGATLRRRALAIAEDPPTDRQQQYIDDEVPSLARIRYAIAGPALALGVGLLVGGGLALRKAAGPRVTLGPTLAPGHGGLTLRGRF